MRFARDPATVHHRSAATLGGATRVAPVLALCVVVALPVPKAQAQGAPTAATASTSPHTEVLAPYRRRLIGVFDDRSGSPVEGADVIDVMTGTFARTTSTGTVALAYLPEGGALLRIRKVGYEPQTLMASISPADTLPITLVLRRVVELPAIATIDSAPRYIAPALRGFEDRRRNAVSGTFVTEAEIRKEDHRNLGNFLLAKLSGVTIQEGRQGQMFLKRSPRCGSGDPPAVYVDGVPRTSPTRSAPALAFQPKKPAPSPLDNDEVDLSQIDLTDLAGIEYYANTATAPSQFNGTSSSCGVLLLWTRQQ